MRFSEQLEEGMRDKWRAYYLNYVGLRTRIEELEADPTATNAEFLRQLHMQIVKVVTFYDTAEERLRSDLQALATMATDLEKLTPGSEKVMRSPSTASRETGVAMQPSLSSRTVTWARRFTPGTVDNLPAVQAVLKEAESLKQYAKLNTEGLRKIAKKYDKRCGKSKTLKEDLLGTLRGSRIAAAEDRIDEMIESFTAGTAGIAEERSEADGKAVPLLWTSPANRHKKGLVRRGSTMGNLGFSWVIEKHERQAVPKTSPALEPRDSGDLRLLLATSVESALWPPSAEVYMPVVFLVTCLLPYWLHANEDLDWKSYFTIFVTLEALFLLVRQNAPDVVLVFATLVLTLSGVLTDAEAWAGFSNEVVLSVGVLGVVSAGIQSTGVVGYIFLRILGKPQSFPIAFLRLCLPAFVLNSCVSNTCVMGVLVPVIETWSKGIEMHPALFLMPFSYMMLISGTICIFSTSSNLITQGMLTERKYEPFSNFEISSLSALCTLVTLVYMTLALPILLSRFRMKKVLLDGDEILTPSLACIRAGMDMRLYVASIQMSGVLPDDATLKSSGLLEILPGGLDDIVRFERMAEEILNIDAESPLKQYDVLYIWSRNDAISALRAKPWITFIALDAGCEHNYVRNQRQVVEVVLDGLCPLVKEKLTSTRQLDALYSASCIAVRPCHMQHFSKPEAQAAEVKTFIRQLRYSKDDQAYRFSIGDNLLLDVPLNFYEMQLGSVHFTSIHQVDTGEDEKEEKAEKEDTEKSRQKNQDMVVSALLLIFMVSMVASNTLSLLQASLLTTFGLVTTGCMERQRAYNAVNIRTLLTIVGAFGLGKAIGSTGVAKVLATGLCNCLRPFGSTGLFSAIFAATVGLGVVFHATAVVILMFPICEQMSLSEGIPLHQACAILMIGAGCQMLSPVSYQTNLMAFNSGYYTFADFPRVGIGAVLVIGVCAVLSVDSLIDPQGSLPVP